MPHIRALVLAGRRAEAARLLTGGRELEWTQSFHPGYALTVDAPPGPVRGYRRGTDFTSGEVTVEWPGGRRRCSPPAPTVSRCCTSTRATAWSGRR
ncbi:glycoside hydrolase N-terminal domain-containing protein [Micromonospora sp. BRA006-A]|nr:glycoside hydrolase N-terminal domain-containing protein [Micromonospora sp. BRA006-A]